MTTSNTYRNNDEKRVRGQRLLTRFFCIAWNNRVVFLSSRDMTLLALLLSSASCINQGFLSGSVKSFAQIGLQLLV